MYEVMRIGFRTVDGIKIIDTIEGHALPPEIREDYLESYDGDRFVESMRNVRAYLGALGGGRLPRRGEGETTTTAMRLLPHGGNDEPEQ
jgi:hypothetical protein